MIVDKTSLVNTVDLINEYQFSGGKIPPGEGLELARWISTRQGQPGAYRTMYAPTEKDFKDGR